MTYREVMAVMSGASKYLHFLERTALKAAWHSAAFQRMRRMPRLDVLLREPKRKTKRRRQTPEEQAMIAEQWLRMNERFGTIKVIRDGTAGTGRGTQGNTVT